MTEREIRKWVWDRSLKDRWQVQLNGEAVEGIHPLASALEWMQDNAATIMLLHESLSADAEADWMLLEKERLNVSKQYFSEMRRWLWREGGEDLWWLSDERLVCEDRKTLEEIETCLKAEPDRRWFILHVSMPMDGSAQWVELERTSLEP